MDYRAIMGVNIELTSKPFQATVPCENTFSKAESQAIDYKLIQKGVITQTSHESGEFISQNICQAQKRWDI